MDYVPHETLVSSSDAIGTADGHSDRALRTRSGPWSVHTTGRMSNQLPQSSIGGPAPFQEGGERPRLSQSGALPQPPVEKERVDREQEEVKSKYQTPMSDNNELLDRCNAAERKVVDGERKIKDLLQQVEKLKRQLAQEADKSRLTQNDNIILRAQIADMCNAQEPLREEDYYIIEFCQIRIDIESWAAKETKTMPKQPLSEKNVSSLVSRLQSLGEHGRAAGQWILNKEINFFQQRRNRIALIRLVAAIVLFDKVFDLFSFGMGREDSEFFKGIEKDLCLTGTRPLTTWIDL